MNRFKVLASAAALVSLGAGVPAHALTFVFSNTAAGGAEAGTAAGNGFRAAANYWSSILTDNVTVNLTLGFSSLGTGILAQAGSQYALLSNSQGYAALRTDATSQFDFSSTAALQALTPSTTFGGRAEALTFTANALNVIPLGNAATPTVVGYLDTATRLDNDGGVNNSTLGITKASAKALGITTDVNGNAVNYASEDANITFSSGFQWDYDPTDGIDADKFDFIGVAIHEIGHTLGFVSGVDTYDFYTAPGSNRGRIGAVEGLVVNSQLDLFRFSAPGQINLSTQAPVYFSVDGGASQVYGNSWMSTGQFNGDRRQASHFRDSPAGQDQIGVMDPTSGRGQAQEITGQDLAAFDVIGWNVKRDTSRLGGYRYTTASAYNAYNAVLGVPEPAVWMQLILGFGVIGGAVRYRRRRAVLGMA